MLLDASGELLARALGPRAGEVQVAGIEQAHNAPAQADAHALGADRERPRGAEIQPRESPQ